jgi:hypothetical protein
MQCSGKMIRGRSLRNNRQKALQRRRLVVETLARMAKMAEILNQKPKMDIESSALEAEPFSVNRLGVLRICDHLLTTVVRMAQEHLTGKYARLKITVVAVLLSLFVTFPIYEAWSNLLKSVITSQALSWKVQHPLSQVPAYLKNPALYQGNAAGGFSHADKLELRLTVPILGWLSGTGAWTVVVWNHLAGFGIFYLLASLALAALGDSVSGALFVLGLAPTFFAAWSFNDYSYGDGIGYFLMLLSVACRQPLLSAAIFLGAAFCDERCVAAAPLLILYLVFSSRQHEQRAQGIARSLAIVSGVLTWGLLRWWLATTFRLSMGTTELMSWQILRYHLSSSLPGTFLEVFKASWILPAFAFLSLIAQRNWTFSAAFLSAFAVAIAPAFLVWDFARSVGYCFPVLLISLYFLRGDKEAARKYLAAILVINVLLSPPNGSIFRLVGKLIPHASQ